MGKENRLFEYTPPFVEFPANPKIIEINGIKVYDYVSPDEMSNYIKEFSKTIDLNDFDVLLINQKGGRFFAETLMKLQNYRGSFLNVEYHRDHKIIIPVPEDIKKLRLGVFDDIWDSGGTPADILNDAPNSSFVFMTQKEGIEGQILIPRSRVAIQISNVWVGGCGMNLETEGDGLPKDFARDYPSLIAKIL